MKALSKLKDGWCNSSGLGQVEGEAWNGQRIFIAGNPCLGNLIYSQEPGVELTVAVTKPIGIGVQWSLWHGREWF